MRLSGFGAALFELTVPIARHINARERSPIERQVRKVISLSLAAALVFGHAWLLLETHALAGTTDLAQTVTAIPAVLFDTRFGQVPALQAVASGAAVTAVCGSLRGNCRELAKKSRARNAAAVVDGAKWRDEEISRSQITALAVPCVCLGCASSTLVEESPSSEAYKAATGNMHQSMMIDYSGDPDVDFVRGMIPHHQGAVEIDMMQTRLKAHGQ